MSTIAKIAIRLGLENVEFVHRVQQSVNVLGGVSTAVSKNNLVIRASSAAWNVADTAARGHLKTLLGIGAAGTMVVRGLKQFSAAQSSGWDNAGIGRLSDMYDSLTSSVDRAYEAFGRGMAGTANFASTANQLNAIIMHLTGTLETMGSVVGWLYNFLINFPPIFLFIAVAAKAVSAALGVLVHAMIVQAIVRIATLLILGKSMGTISLAIAAAKLAWSAATWVLVQALMMLGYVGASIWAPIAIGIAAVAAVTVGLVTLWKWFTSGGEAFAKTAEMQRIHEATKEATGSIRDFIGALEEANAAAGLSENEKKLREFTKLLDKAEADLRAKGISGVIDRDSLTAQVKYQMEIANTIEKQAKVKKTLRDLEKELVDIGATRGQLAARDVKDAGGTQKQIDEAFKLADQIDDKKKLLEIEKEVRDIMDESRMAGMSAIEKRAEQMKQLGATARQIADVTARMTAAEKAKAQAEEKKKLAEQIASIERDAAEAGLTDTEKKIAALKRLGATQDQINKVQSQLKRAEQAKEAKQVIENAMTPLEKMTKEIAKIEELKKFDPANSAIYDRAIIQEKLKGYEASTFKTAEQGGAVFKGSQADIAARFREKPEIKTQEQQLEVQKQQLTWLEKVHGKLETPPVPQIVELN